MSKLFGTDGIRGVVNQTLTAELVFNLGRALGIVLNNNNKQAKVIVSMDTRISGKMLESSLVGGLSSVGVDVTSIGVSPTPVLSFLVKKLKFDAGVMITASHNQAQFNGLKFFDNTGCKASENFQKEIEKSLNDLENFVIDAHNRIGKIEYNEDLVYFWVEDVIDNLDIDLSNFTIALDCANGASSALAPFVFKRLGAKVVLINNSMHGENINKDCGSQYPTALKQLCAKESIMLGFCYDGDADRVVVVDNLGKVYDGADLMYIFANYLKAKNKLKDDTLVTTVISNCGLENSLNKKGIKLIRTKVGGGYIQSVLHEKSLTLGGEESGHIMLFDLEREADGILASIFLLKIIKETKLSLAELLKGLEKTQTIKEDIVVNPRVKQKVESGAMVNFITELENELLDQGRIIVRPSGTENVIRVLVEGENVSLLEKIKNLIVCEIKKL